MNTTKLIAVLALSFAASGAALAFGEATYEYPQVSTSTLTRAQVIAELKKAQADGSQFVTEGETHKPAAFVAQRSRAEVRAETLAAAASGELSLLNRETNSFDGTVKLAKPEATRMATANTGR